jgi:5-(carboxyamino)imidazole ribonucleotide mutase
MQILALSDEELAIKLKEDKIAKEKKVEMDSLEIETLI